MKVTQKAIQFYRNRGGWQILLPQLARPVANAITTRANQMGATNIISSTHYPINGVLEIYEKVIDLHMSDNNEIELKPDSKVTPLGDCRFDIDGREIEFKIRKLTPRECFRLMDVSEEDIDKIQASGVSNSQQYKMAGNSIVVACLAAIFRQMLTPTDNVQQPQQLKLF